MGNRRRIVCDGNTAAASVAYRLSEVVALYPITPSSPMGELSDEWMAKGKKNVWDTVPEVIEMQSEGGAAGAVHGSLQAGALTTTFTASQGLLLMIPNMYKIAGELTSYAMHVSARTLATHALSIFGDHSDVMACRQTGFALLASASVQEVQDLAAIAHVATLASRIPFLHFFDGFRTSHELAKITELTDDDLRALVDESRVEAHRARALTPDRPLLRGTAQNPDAFFQAREACNPFYAACAGHVAATMAKFEELTGRAYGLFDYVGAKDAERVVVVMGSGAETCDETVRWLNAKGEKAGVLKVRLYRPWSLEHFVAALPVTVKTIAVLDRTKEPGAPGDPLWLDVVAALAEARATGVSKFSSEPRVIAGRYGLSSKEFTPAMVAAVFAEMAKPAPKRQFTIGIVDDVTHTSLPWDDSIDIEPEERVKAVFFGLGSDGTVSANKNSIQIIGEDAGKEAQAYFVYDSKKAGAVTTSHLRFGEAPIRAAWLVSNAGFVACHQFSLLDKQDMLSCAKPGGVFLLNAPFGPGEIWDELPFEVQSQIVQKKLRFHVVDAYRIARDAGLGGRINTIMQTCFFALSGILPAAEAIERIKKGIRKSYSRRGEAVLQKNFAAVDAATAGLQEVQVPASVTTQRHMPPPVAADAPDFVQRVSGVLLSGKGDLLPVSAFPPDGTWPTATAKWEKRNIALDIPVWDEKLCIQCNKCAMVCPHAAIRAKLFVPAALDGAPATFKSVDFRATEWQGHKYTIQVAPEDCTGCTLCMMVCPAKDKSNPKHKALDMAPQAPLREPERANYAFFLDIPEVDRTKLRIVDVKSSQFLEPLFEYSGACAGCGETPYIKLLTQLFGDRTMIANATGCSSIYGGNLPTTPFTVNRDGRGPTWSNSLFEDNAEFGLGMRLGVDHHEAAAKSLLQVLAAEAGSSLVVEILAADQSGEAGIAAQRSRVAELIKRLAASPKIEAKRLASIADYLVKKSIWVVGGDGWAYDIGYGGLDHVLAVGRDVNILVLDTEVYSNTGGQASKATPLGASAKFATAGKTVSKKDLGLMAMAYGSVYVARVAFGAKDAQTVKAFQEAESYRGTSLIIAYSPCIAHGYDMAFQLDQQTKAVQSGYWPLYRFDPRRTAAGESPLAIDTGTLKGDIGAFMRNEARFRVAEEYNPDLYKATVERARREAGEKVLLYEQLAKKHVAEAAARPGN
ncbi:MAG: pyruvate:ferredoxin (flavodoxin) oxidoreductase [Thermoanaerobaculia bacterium]